MGTSVGTTLFCHSREGGNPFFGRVLDSRLRGNDKIEGITNIKRLSTILKLNRL